ncbi:hypothetical protein Zmor_015013 [Zophobas morio]|uniref:Uncharacterized protein n=1 Tax=Zophobas morio TaxID=2755281 RepID=A0AA38IGI1_9CUCU|nr:hypothetical protein Zmor_015013 [Zophobas morio]
MFLVEHNLPFLLISHFIQLCALIFYDPQIAKGLKISRNKNQLKFHMGMNSSAALTKSKVVEIFNLFDENTPDGLQKNFFHIVADELAWRGGEGTLCLVSYFNVEFDHKGARTEIVEYNSILSKRAQGGSKKLTDSKWLQRNQKNINH